MMITMSESTHSITFLVDGEPFHAYPGDTVAVVLYRAGKRAWRQTRAGEARGLLCGMGTCYDCLVAVDGVADVRACLALVREGMVVRTNWNGEGPG